MRTNLPVLLSIALLGGCAKTPAFPQAHYANAPVITVVNDRKDIPQPKEVKVKRSLRGYRYTFHDRMTRAFDIRRPRRALGVNAADEVPDSTWFTNRIGVHALTPDEVRTGNLVTESPELHKPWTILSTKSGGMSQGFVFQDARGIKYILKFDGAQFPEAETGTDPVVARILWACGYNVPENQIVTFSADDMVVADTAVVKNFAGGTERKLTLDSVKLTLSKLPRNADGSLRGLISQIVDGKVIGDIVPFGVRGDDPNDRIPHHLRRDMRGMYAILAWLAHSDIASNTMDVYVADPADPKVHYVKHYFVDFGKALAGIPSSNDSPWLDYNYFVDFGSMFVQVVSFGTAPAPWVNRRGPQNLRGVWALFEAEHYDPRSWRPILPWEPLLDADRFDNFWAAKIIAKFTRAQIRAAVEAGEFTDPKAIDYLTDVLVARQRRTVQTYFSEVNPLDKFATAQAGTATVLCFDDLAIQYGFASSAGTSYSIRFYDQAGKPGPNTLSITATSTGHNCTAALAPLDGYTIARIETLRPAFAGKTDVHLADSPVTRAPRVIGVYRL